MYTALKSISKCAIIFLVFCLIIGVTRYITGVTVRMENQIGRAGGASRRVEIIVETDGKELKEAEELIDESTLPDEPAWRINQKWEGDNFPQKSKVSIGMRLP